jgi:c-di-GMP-binding flagellar brake protein YcgR
MSRLQTPELAALAPWLLKIDWTLELMLKTLRRLSKDGVSIPQLTDVNISAAGVRFHTGQPFAEGDRLALQLILPPFTPIRTIAQVTRVLPGHSPDERELATQFVEINEDDRERLIRHILQVEAERLRARRVPAL